MALLSKSGGLKRLLLAIAFIYGFAHARDARNKKNDDSRGVPPRVDPELHDPKRCKDSSSGNEGYYSGDGCLAE